MSERKRIPRGERLLSGTLSAYLSAVDTSMTVSNPPSASKLPTYFEIEPDSTSNRETVRIIEVSGFVCTIERGVYDGGTGKEHQSNSTYKQKFTQKHWDAITDALEQGYLTEDSSHTLSRTSATVFTITTNGVDLTNYYTKGRILRFNGNDANLAIVVSSSYAANVTTITVTKGTVPSPLTSVAVGVMPRGAAQYFAAQAILEGSANYAADSGAADAYAVTLDTKPAAYAAGLIVVFKAANANTTTSTLNVNSLGTKTIKKFHDRDLSAGDIEAGQICVVVYDGTDFQLVSFTSVPSINQYGSEIYGADGGSTDAYAITLNPALGAYVTGMVINFYANTANTGAASLNVNSLGAKTIKKNHDQDLADGDIEAGQIVTVVYDGTNFQMQSQIANTGSVATVGSKRVRAYRTTSQTIANNTDTAIQFDNESFDTDTMHDNSSNNSRITFTTAGVYQVNAHACWAGNTTGRRFSYIRLNGSAVISQSEGGDPTSSGYADAEHSFIYSFSAGDYIQFEMTQGSGGNLDMVGGQPNHFDAHNIS